MAVGLVLEDVIFLPFQSPSDASKMADDPELSSKNDGSFNWLAMQRSLSEQ